MKHRPLLRLLTLISIVIASLGLMAVRHNKKISTSVEQSQEINSNTGSKNAPNEVMLWESLSRHLLSFK